MKHALCAVSLALLSCSPSSDPSSSTPPGASTSTLPVGLVANVGSLPIGAATVAAVSKAQQVPVRDALDREIEDALFASAALERGLDQGLSVRAALRGVLARSVLEALKKEASQTEPEDAEIAEATARHFVELDRPEASRVIHAVVRVPENADQALVARAKALAERLADQVSTAGDETEFRNLAEAIGNRNGLELVVETVGPMAADGRTVDVENPTNRETFAPAFAHAASRLSHPHQKSGVVQTEFGYHVMMLLQRTPSHVVPLEERRRLLRDEILTDRARRLKKELLSRIRSSLPTSVERSAGALLATVPVDGHEAP
jgi:parvulin-like peptidyl-prolyl isomerase